MEKQIPTKNTLAEKVKQHLAASQKVADKRSDKFVIGFFLLGFLLMFVYQTWLLSIISMAFTGLLYVLGRFAIKRLFWRRMLISVVYSLFGLIFIGQMQGMAEMHFFFFINLALLIVYQDWRMMIPYTGLFILHHVTLVILQTYFQLDVGKYFINYAEVNASTLFWHFSLAVLMSFISGLWAHSFKKKSVALIEEQLQLQLTLENERTLSEEIRQNLEVLGNTQDQLEQLNNSNQALLNAIGNSIGYVELALDKTIITTNALFSDWSEYAREELIGLRHEDLIFSQYKQSEEYRLFWEKLLSGESVTGIFERKTKKGKKIWLYASYAPVKNAKGEVTKIVKLCANYTEQKLAQEQIEDKNRKQEVLNAILHYSVLASNLDDFLRETAESLRQIKFLNLLPGIGIFIMDKAENVLKMRVQKDISPMIQKLCAKVQIGNCLCGTAALTKQTQYAHCVDERHTVRFDGIKPHGHYNIPILYKEELLGVIVVYLPHGHKKDEEEVRFLESIASIVSQTIVSFETKEKIEQQNQQLLASEEELRQNLEELQATQEELEKQKQQLSAIKERYELSVAGSSDGIWDWNMITNEVYFSPRWKELLGYQDHELPNEFNTFANLILEEDREYVFTTLNQYLKREIEAYNPEFRMKHKDGTSRWIQAKGAVFVDEFGAPYRMSGTHSDITERKIKEAEIRKLSLVAQKTINAVIITDKNGLIEWCNEGFTRISGYTLPEVVGKKPGSILQGKDTNPQHVEKIRQGIASRKPFTQEILNYHKNGTPYWLEINISPIFNEKGELTNFIALEMDITEKKQREIDREQRQKRLEQRNKILTELSTTPFASYGSLQKAIEAITEAATKGLNTSRASFWNYDGKSIICADLYERDKREHSQGIELFEKDFPKYFEGIKTGRAVVANDAHTHQYTSEFSEVYLKPLGIESMLDVPIRVEGEMIGVLCCESVGEKRRWTDDDVSFARSIADIISLAIEADKRKKAEEEIRVKNEELLASEEELRQNVEQLQATQEALEKQKKELEQALEEIKNTQAQLLLSEKMASLGQLVASIAHEINTPLGAIRSSNNMMRKQIEENIFVIPEKLKNLSTEEFSLLKELVDTSKSKVSLLTIKEERKIRRNLTNLLEDNGIPESDFLAELIVEMGIYEEVETFLPLLKEEKGREIIKMAHQISGLLRSANNINTATEKASKVVFALKNYARQDASGEKIPADIHENIDTVLTLYHNQLKHGVEVVKNYDNFGQIFCYPDELIQVWTNLIHNAAQAMNYKGTLTITTQKIDDRIRVSIKDTGTGIPDEIKDKIFNAFFTTKKAGEGSGLGLDIVRKIVEKHEGKIWFESQVGVGTTFFVELPALVAEKVES